MNKVLANLILVVVVLLASASAPAFCQAKDQILFGFTNVSQALMLHPTMARYQIKEGRFSPTADKDKPAKKSENKLNEFTNKRNQLLEEKASYDAQMQKEDAELSAAISALNVKYNSKRKESSPVIPSDQYNREKDLLESKFWVQRRNLQVKLADIDNLIAKMNEENELIHLTSADETERAFKIMLDEIYEAIDMVAKHYKVNVVFNSSFSVERTPVNPAFTPINPLGEFFSAKFSRDASETLHKHGDDGTAPLMMTLSYWMATQRWAFRTTVDPRLDKMFLKGGLDMTPAVVDYVYQKHNVPVSHRDVIQEFLKTQSK